MSEILSAMKDIRIVSPVLSIKSSLKDEQIPLLEEMSDALVKSING